jgi:hypothetical protein
MRVRYTILKNGESTPVDEINTEVIKVTRNISNKNVPITEVTFRNNDKIYMVTNDRQHSEFIDIVYKTEYTILINGICLETIPNNIEEVADAFSKYRVQLMILNDLSITHKIDVKEKESELKELTIERCYLEYDFRVLKSTEKTN